jgi:hypothetical protein
MQSLADSLCAGYKTLCGIFCGKIMVMCAHSLCAWHATLVCPGLITPGLGRA